MGVVAGRPGGGRRALARLCNQPGATRPTGTVGTSTDNTARESFHTSLKRETLQGAHDYGDPGTCRRDPCGAPWSEWNTGPSGLLRVTAVIRGASVTRL
ncbi:hypothetical protein ACIP62_39920, partial [Streptomyces murinus]